MQDETLPVEFHSQADAFTWINTAAPAEYDAVFELCQDQHGCGPVGLSSGPGGNHNALALLVNFHRTARVEGK